MPKAIFACKNRSLIRSQNVLQKSASHERWIFRSAGPAHLSLDFVARTSITTGQGLENRRLDYIAANNGNVRWGVFGLWFFNKPLDLDQFAVICAGVMMP